MGSSNPALIFSGHNQRAVIALVRYLEGHSLRYYVVASGPDDPIYNTDYSENVVFQRSSKKVCINLFEDILERITGENPVYLPTTEFINDFVLENREGIERLGILVKLCEKSVYNKLTSKVESQDILCVGTNIIKVPVQSKRNLKAPCVFKPYVNIKNGVGCYPIICRSDSDLEKLLQEVDVEDYFVQNYVDGASYYLCGYLSESGGFCGYFQKNIAQQEGGKSIVFAESCENPGVDVEAIVKRLTSVSYYGAVMIEVIESDGAFYYIEMNPRFWGPLQLGIDSYPRFLGGFVFDYFDCSIDKISGGSDFKVGVKYSWLYGAISKKYRLLPQSGNVESEMFKLYDIYNRLDTGELHGRV